MARHDSSREATAKPRGLAEIVQCPQPDCAKKVSRRGLAGHLKYAHETARKEVAVPATVPATVAATQKSRRVAATIAETPQSQRQYPPDNVFDGEGARAPARARARVGLTAEIPTASQSPRVPATVAATQKSQRYPLPDDVLGGEEAREGLPAETPAASQSQRVPATGHPAPPPAATRPDTLIRALQEQQAQIDALTQTVQGLRAGAQGAGAQGQGSALSSLFGQEQQAPQTDPALLQLAALFREFAQATKQENAETRALVAQAMDGRGAEARPPVAQARQGMDVLTEMTDLPATINVDFPLDPQTMMAFSKVRLKMPHVYPNLPEMDWFIHYARFNQESTRLYWAQPKHTSVLNCPHCRTPVKIPDDCLPTNPFQVMPGVFEGGS